MTQRKVHIVYWRYLYFDGSERFIGGIETYLYHLCQLIVDLGHQPVIFQCASHDFQVSDGGVRVVGLKVTAPDSFEAFKTANLSHLCSVAVEGLNPDFDLVIFGTDDASLTTGDITSIAIQHGISWDRPIRLMTERQLLSSGLGERFRRWLLRHNALKKFRRSTFKVCVDFNFLNWYRTYYDGDSTIRVILNCTDHVALDRFANKMENIVASKSRPIRVLFARRFEQFRGTRLMSDAVNIVHARRSDVLFTFAGYGSDSDFLKKKFLSNELVSFVEFTSDQSLEVNFSHDISVIPSLGSEGSSFSVAEAMGAGSAVIATDIGGVTNMVLDGFNGLLIRADPEELAEKIIELAENSAYRKQLCEAAYGTAVTTFSLEKWRKQWANLLGDAFQ